eukprot:m.186962 g.186962  ORF g.186962 m.186962 type:complete len:351 (+) comp25607_c0_seq4:185-1237(+)
MKAILSCLVIAVVTLAQNPTPQWNPSYQSLGVYCWADAPNPNEPTTRGHVGGCGCENTNFRIQGQLYMMESTGHSCDVVFPGYNSTLLGDCSYFRIRNMTSGRIIANVSQSLGHSFFAASYDHERETLWVFGSAHARNNKLHPGPCDIAPHKGCYVGAWSSKDLTTWSATAKALTLPDGYSFYNNDVTFVRKMSPDSDLPKHQAVMILEWRQDDPHHFPHPSPFAINTGEDGDLSTNWVLLDPDNYTITGFPKGAAGEGLDDAPTIRAKDAFGAVMNMHGDEVFLLLWQCETSVVNCFPCCMRCRGSIREGKKDRSGKRNKTPSQNVGESFFLFVVDLAKRGNRCMFPHI